MDHQDYQKYRDYQATDFVLNLSFQRWAQGSDDSFWSRFQEAYPEKQETIQEAIALVNQLQVQQKPLSPSYVREQLAMVYAKIDQRARQAPVALPWYRTSVFRYAASGIVLLLASALFYFYQTTSDYVYETAYQETQTIQLKDGTEVVLNANSSLRVPSKLETAAVREVWLDGEAFFTVSSSVVSDEPQQFVVHTSQLAVEVLGTVFNVKSRSGGTQVLLEEGSVRVVRPETQEQLLM
ncbi:MAG: FecR family protein, partial [Bacteroidota bacterium]